MALAPRLARGNIYYGWYIVGVAFLTSLAMAGSRLLALSIFLKPMVAELDWNRGQFALFASLGSLASSFLTPAFGPLIDRRGARELLLGGALVAGAGFMGLGLVREPWHFIVVYDGPVSLGMAGMSTAVANVAVANWFVRKRGRAIAFGTLGLSVAAIVYPPLVGALMSAFGWRWAWVAIGGLLWLLMLLPVGLLMRRRPEDLGLLPDGERLQAQTRKTAISVEPTWSSREVVRTSALWLLVGAFGLYMLGLSSVMFHLASYLTDVGFSLGIATALLAVWGFGDLVGRVPWGLAVERISPKRCAMVIFMATALSTGLIALSGPRLLPAAGAVALYGLVICGTGPIEEVFFANYYGRPSLGRVRTIALPFIVLGGAVGAPIAGYIRDNTGSYSWAFVVSVTAILAGSVFLLMAHPPRRPR